MTLLVSNVWTRHARNEYDSLRQRRKNNKSSGRPPLHVLQELNRPLLRAQMLADLLKFVLIVAQSHTSHRRVRNHVLRRALVISAGQQHTNVRNARI